MADEKDPKEGGGPPRGDGSVPPEGKPAPRGNPPGDRELPGGFILRRPSPSAASGKKGSSGKRPLPRRDDPRGAPPSPARPSREGAVPPRGGKRVSPPAPAEHGKGSRPGHDERPVFRPPPFPELLAPAGSVEAYFAAVEAGADAVYLGLQRFNARERADNFTLEDLCRILPHAKREGRRVYLAMNTLVTEAELPEAVRLLHQVEPLSPDAVIVADLGLLRVVRERFPSIEVHVSTQVGCASTEAAEAFARLGASRVILERHLHLPEVRRIASAAPLGVEIFVHGSLCYCYSGKCYFSSFLGGKSGNRGACVQPCRRLYGGGAGEAEALFSTRDLCLIDRIPELSRMGLTSLKIEGRMRSAEYVSAVVSAYRAALDLSREGKDGEAVARGRELLAVAVGRAETAGITGGALPGDVVSGGATGNVGELLGEVTEVRDGWALVPAPADAIPGDRLRIQFREDGSGKGFTALSLKSSPEGFRVKVPFDLSPGDLLFRTGGGGRREITRAAVKEFASLPTEALSFRVRAGGGVVAVDASFGKVHREYSYRVAGGATRSRDDFIPGDASHRLRTLLRLDLPLGEVKVEGRGGSGSVPWGDVESLFVKAARAFDREFHIAGKEAVRTVLPSLRVVGNREEEVPTLWFLEVSPAQLHRIPRGEAYLPVTEFTRALARDPSPVVFGAFRDRGYFRLPAPLFEEDGAFLRRTVKESVEKGFTRWIVSDAGHFRIFDSLRLRDRVTLVSDHVLYGFNLGSLATLSRMGASRMILPVEAPLPALADVARYLYGLGVAYVYGRLPLMASRLLPAAGVRTGTVTSPRGEVFRVESTGKGSLVRPAVPFSASGHLGEMRGSGIRDFYADLRGLEGEREIPAVLDALLSDREIPGTDPFNLLRTNF